MPKVVIFDKDGCVRIMHVDDTTPYEGKPNCLIDPAFPRGIPPHEWKLAEGRIEGTPALPQKATIKRVHPALLLALLASLLLNIVGLYLRFH